MKHCVYCDIEITEKAVIYVRELKDGEWTNPCCTKCWYERNPDRQPHRLNDEAFEENTDQEIKRHAKKAMDATEERVDNALESLEMDGFLHKDGDKYKISSKGIQLVEEAIDAGFKVQLVCLECRTVFVKEEEAKMMNLKSPGLCSLCQGKLMWEPLIKGKQK